MGPFLGSCHMASCLTGICPCWSPACSWLLEGEISAVLCGVSVWAQAGGLPGFLVWSLIRWYGSLPKFRWSLNPIVTLMCSNTCDIKIPCKSAFYFLKHGGHCCIDSVFGVPLHRAGYLHEDEPSKPSPNLRITICPQLFLPVSLSFTTEKCYCL